MTLDEEKEDFLRYLAGVRNLSVQSVKCYGESLGILSRFFAGRGKCDVRDFGIDDAHDLMKSFFFKGLSSASVNRHLSAYKQFFIREIKKGVVAENPFSLVRTNKRERKLPVFLTGDELAKLLCYNRDSDDFDGLLDRTALVVLIFTGIRREELLGIRCGEINFDRNEIRVHGKGAKDRIVFFTEYCKSVIRKYLGKRMVKSEFLLSLADGAQMTVSRLNETFKKLGKSGIIKKHITPHVLRHSFASFLLENGTDIMLIKKMLGHESISATGVYTHMDLHKMIDVYDSVFEN